MAKLIFSMDGVVIREFALQKERTTLGRKASNDIQVDNLAVSGEHAVIFTMLNDSFVEDLNSTNGTFVNGKPVRRHLLQSGDVIELGKHKLKYINDGKGIEGLPVDYQRTDYERTMVIRSAAAKLPPEEGAAPPLDVEEVRRSAVNRRANGEANAVQLHGAIQVLTGSAVGRSLDLNKELTTIGKGGGDVAVVTKRPSGYFITPVEGNPPLLNGRLLDAQAHVLNDHDIIELAGVKLEFYFKR